MIHTRMSESCTLRSLGATVPGGGKAAGGRVGGVLTWLTSPLASGISSSILVDEGGARGLSLNVCRPGLVMVTGALSTFKCEL